jgi:hypothetical protein
MPEASASHRALIEFKALIGSGCRRDSRQAGILKPSHLAAARGNTAGKGQYTSVLACFSLFLCFTTHS